MFKKKKEAKEQEDKNVEDTTDKNEPTDKVAKEKQPATNQDGFNEQKRKKCLEKTTTTTIMERKYP